MEPAKSPAFSAHPPAPDAAADALLAAHGFHLDAVVQQLIERALVKTHGNKMAAAKLLRVGFGEHGLAKASAEKHGRPASTPRAARRWRGGPVGLRARPPRPARPMLIQPRGAPRVRDVRRTHKLEVVMGSFLGGWFSYGLGRSIGQALFGENANSDFQAGGPIRQQTEEEIRADEKRYDEEAKRLDEEDRKRLHH